MTTPKDVVAAARALIGTPYHHLGRLPGVGIDCAGVLIVIARDLGLVDAGWNPDPYSMRPDGESLQALCDQMMQRAGAISEGCAILIAWLDGPPQHLGIVTLLPDGAHGLVHADGRRAMKVVEQRLVLSRAMRLVQAYRLPGAIS